MQRVLFGKRAGFFRTMASKLLVFYKNVFCIFSIKREEGFRGVLYLLVAFFFHKIIRATEYKGMKL